MTSHDDDRGWEAGSSGMGCASAATHSSRRLARSPTDHFKRLLEKACPNHAYPLGTDSRSFMTSASHTLAAEPNEGPDGSDVAPFPKENAVMTVLGGCPLEGRCRMPSLSPRISSCGGWATGAQGCNSASSPPHSNKNINIYISICFLQSSPKATEKRGTGSVPWAGAGVQRFLQAFQDEGDNP
jgi:hypothetical protein